MTLSMVLGTCFTLCGLGLSAGTVRMVRRRRAFLEDSTSGFGVVISLNADRDPEGTTYFPVVQFRAPGGKEITFQSVAGSSPAAWDIGDKVPIRYRRNQPESAEIASRLTLWGPTITVALLGAVFLVVGIGILKGWLG